MIEDESTSNRCTRTNGQIGQQLVHILQKSQSCEVIAGLRSVEQEKAYQEQGIATAFVDLTKPQK